MNLLSVRIVFEQDGIKWMAVLNNRCGGCLIKAVDKKQPEQRIVLLNASVQEVLDMIKEVGVIDFPYTNAAGFFKA